MASFPSCTGSSGTSKGGFYLKPNPMQENVNFFPAWLGSPSDQHLGDRNYAILNVKNHIYGDLRKPYIDDQQRMIVIEYSTGDGTSKDTWVIEYLVCVGQASDGHLIWDNPFGVVSGSVNLSRHSIVELRDGEFYVDAINTLEHNQTNLIADTAANMHDIRMIDADLKRGDFKLIGETEEEQQYVLNCVKAASHFTSDGSITITPVGPEDNCKIELKANIPEISGSSINTQIGNGTPLPTDIIKIHSGKYEAASKTLEVYPLQLRTGDDGHTDAKNISFLESSESVHIINTDGVAKLHVTNDNGLFLGSFGNVSDLPLNPAEGSFAYILNATEEGVIQRNNPTLYMYQASRWAAKYTRGAVVAKASSGQYEHVEKIEVQGSIAQSIDNGVLHLDFSSLSQGDFKGFFNRVDDLPTSAVSANESYAYVFTAEGEGSVSAGKLIPQLYVYQVQGSSVPPTWTPQHTKGAVICNTDKSDSGADRPIEAITFTGDLSKRKESPNRNLEVELPFTMDSHFAGIFESSSDLTNAVKSYKGKFVQNQITGIIKESGKYKLVRWNQNIQNPTEEEILNDTHWTRIPLSGGGSRPLYDGQQIKVLAKNDRLYSFDAATGTLTGNEREYNFIGFFETGAALREHAVTVANHLVKDFSFGLVRKTAVGTGAGTHYYKFYIWSLDSANPSDAEVLDTTSWDSSNTVLNKDYAITVTGNNSEHDSWTPTAVISTMPAAKHVGQVVYYNKGASADTGHYYSDGNIWHKMPTSQKVTPITARTENQPDGEYQAISKIDIIGDSTLANIEEGELTINVKSAVARAADETELKSKYPVSQSFSTIGMTEDNDTLWLVRKGNSSQGTVTKWERMAYLGMSDDVTDLIDRYPHDLSNPMAQYQDDNYKKLCRISFSEEAAKSSLHIPVPQVGVLENDYLGTITGTQEYWVQTFTGFDTGEKWTRRMMPSGATNEWSDWKEEVQKLPLDDTNYTILTIENGTKGKDIQGAAIPWRKLQDHTCNIKTMAHNAFRIMRSGKYTVTVVTHFSGKEDWSGHSADVTTEIFFAGESVARHKKSGTLTAGGAGEHVGEYPASKAVFEIDLASHETFDIRHIVTKGEDTYIDTSDLDPYKNYVVIEPVSSNTKTGIEIAETLCTSLGGISFIPGQEVRMEAYGSGNRVFGERYRIDLVDLV